MTAPDAAEAGGVEHDATAPREMAPCPFCGMHLMHKPSWAMSFQPNRLYHEYHHPTANCILGGRNWTFSDTGHAGEAMDEFSEQWNRRATLNAYEALVAERDALLASHRQDGEALNHFEVENRALELRVAELEESLQFYANPEIYKAHPDGPAFDRRDLSFHARTTLATQGTEPAK